jgi:peptidoglycan/LPS O-acetylase OafA/YrhL
MTRSEAKLAYIDCTRGIAILMVIAVHVSQSVPGLPASVLRLAQYGQMGVQLFFVASALTLCLSMHRRGEAASLTDFYLRRFFRVAPLYWLAIALYGGLFALGINPMTSAGPYSYPAVLANVTFTHGFIPGANNSIVPGGWSIGTEMAFYAVFPFLFKACRWVHARRGLLGLLGVITASLVADFVLMGLLSHYAGRAMFNNGFLYLNLVNQLPVFLTGIAAFFIFYTEKVHIPAPVAIIGFSMATALAMLLWDAPRAFVFIPTISGASFVLLLAILRRMRSEDGIIQRLGRVSFSMYVFHFLMAWGAGPWLAANFIGSIGPTAFFLALLISTICVTWLIATISERWIERPGLAVATKVKRMRLLYNQS